MPRAIVYPHKVLQVLRQAVRDYFDALDAVMNAEELGEDAAHQRNALRAAENHLRRLQ